MVQFITNFFNQRRVHVVRGDYGMNGNGLTKDMGSIPWQEQHFSINRFYFDSENTQYKYDEDLFFS